MTNQSGYQQTSITFYGEDIIALQDLDPNETYVVIAQLCLQMGLNRAVQEQRIRAHAVLAHTARKLPIDNDGQHEDAWCLRVDTLPLWLAGIESASVDQSARAVVSCRSINIWWRASVAMAAAAT